METQLGLTWLDLDVISETELPALIFCCHVLFLSGSSVSAFRFDGGEGVGRPDFFGEAGLMNAVPRMGKRVGNPFDSRFRFRFNNW